MNLPIFKALPGLAAFAALIVWGLTLPQLAAFGGHLVGTLTVITVVGIGLAVLLTIVSLIPKMGSALALWLSGGIWTGAAYISAEAISIAYFIVAFLTLGSAALREYERGKFTISGPAAFFAAALVMVLVSNVFSG